VAAYTDLTSRKVPNALTYSAISLGLVLNGLFWGTSGILDSFQAAGLAVAFLIGPVAVRGIGAGDLKLLVSIGSLAGVKILLLSFFWSALIAGAVAVVFIAYRRLALMCLPMVTNRRLAFFVYPVSVGLDLTRVRALPYAAAMALGCLLALYAR
jgi:prepilin peptidase CpaA